MLSQQKAEVNWSRVACSVVDSNSLEGLAGLSKSSWPYFAVCEAGRWNYCRTLTLWVQRWCHGYPCCGIDTCLSDDAAWAESASELSAVYCVLQGKKAEGPDSLFSVIYLSCWAGCCFIDFSRECIFMLLFQCSLQTTLNIFFSRMGRVSICWCTEMLFIIVVLII